MAFDNNFTAVTGATYTAAQYNTHTRDNLTAIWVYTTSGDMSYATSSTTLARLGIGSTGAIMRVSAGAPSWLAVGNNYEVLKTASGVPAWSPFLQYATVYRASNLAFSSGSGATIGWTAETADAQGWHDNSTNNTRITVTDAGLYVPFVSIYFNRDSGGSGTFEMSAKVQLNGVDTANKITTFNETTLTTKQFTFGGVPVSATAAQYFSVFFIQESGGSGNLISGPTTNTFSLLRIG